MLWVRLGKCRHGIYGLGNTRVMSPLGQSPRGDTIDGPPKATSIGRGSLDYGRGKCVC